MMSTSQCPASQLVNERVTSILVVTGSFPPDICGVGDYTRLLVDGLRRHQADVTLFCERAWSLPTLLRFRERVRQSKPVVINIQYPTIGYGRSIIPHLLSLFSGSAKTVVTMHEVSRAGLMGRLSRYLFFLFADRIIFTTDYERETACNLAPWLKGRSMTINIGSNIPMRDGHLRDLDIAYFGHICPDKGMEEFASVVELIQRRSDLKIKVIGQVEPGAEAYATAICTRMRELGADVLLNMPPDEVSAFLTRTRVALLPFTDGMSLRRGSALASMGNGALLLTTPSVSDSVSLEGKCLMAKGAVELYATLTKALDDYSLYEGIRVAGQEFARSFSWDVIVPAYLKTIAEL